jgi:hypothetical protein
MMKQSLLALSAMLLAACAGVHVSKTDVATGATGPKAIYIRPFDITYTDYIGHHSGGPGERPIRRSLAPAEFAEDLRYELSKTAPARVLKDDEVVHTGWLVTGDLVLVDAGNPTARNFFGVFKAGQSKVKIHVRVTDLDGKNGRADAKEADPSKELASGRGNIIYEFDVEGGSGASGKVGSIYAPGLGYSVPFDFRNAAERIALAITPDAQHYGVRTSPTIR